MAGVRLVSWARGYRRVWLVADIWAGITIAAITIPEDMGYTRITCRVGESAYHHRVHNALEAIES